ncbi:MAG: YeeE/YedE family protein [Burkholderiaceae bacterium]
MTGSIGTATIVVWGGFVVAFVFGVVAARANFCTMGAISDVVNMGHWGRMRMWLLAIAVAIIGAGALQWFGLVDLAKSIYPRPRLAWLSAIVGGALFGIGMSLAGGCANKNLLRVGAGSLRSVVVLAFLGISAYMTIKGLFGQWRVDYLDRFAVDLSAFGIKGQDLPTLLASATGLSPHAALAVAVAVIAGALLAFVFADARFRSNPTQVASGAILGLLVVGAWYVSGHIGYGEHPETMEDVFFATNTRAAESLSFVAPVAFGLELLMLWTDKSLAITFGIASALGIVAGSLVWALATRQFRLEGFASATDTRDHIVGAILMGFGGVTALGCTIGQGITGVSTLAVGSFLALGSIIAGAVATMKYLLWREERA